MQRLVIICSIIYGTFGKDIVIPRAPPEPWKAALMARYIMHNSDWVSIATISTQNATRGYPFVTLKSLSDGKKKNSTGIPYIYMTAMDVSGKDVEEYFENKFNMSYKVFAISPILRLLALCPYEWFSTQDNRVTIMASLAQSTYCETENFDPQDPRCAKVLITGRFRKVSKLSPEYQFGLDALFDRHPSMKNWPPRHNFYVAKVDLQQIQVLDYFGGLKQVTVKDYFDANITDIINYDLSVNISIVDIIN